MNEGNRPERNREGMEPAALGAMGTGEPVPSARKRRKKWPLLAMGAAASVTIWSGWVRLGQMTGFGEVHLLPGIWDALRLNVAITLPIGMEAYAAYGLGVWLDKTVPRRARKFAMWSSIAALLLGMTGQAIAHLLISTHHTVAPGWVVVVVSCLPVIIVGMGAALHYLQDEDEEPGSTAWPSAPVAAPVPYTAEVVPAQVPSAEPRAIEGTPPAVPVPSAADGTGREGAVDEEPAPVPPVEPPAPTEPVPAPPPVEPRPARNRGPRTQVPQTVGGRRVTLQDAGSLLPKAIDANNAHRAANDGRDISGKNLAAELGVHKATALALLRQIKADEATGRREAVAR